MKKMLVMVAAALMLVGCGGVDIPNVVGESEDVARGAMLAAGAEYEVEYETTDEAAPGTVVRVETEDVGVNDAVLIVAEAPTIAITGSFALVEGSHTVGQPCSGSGGYSDFGPGMNVTIRDGNGNVVGSGSTGPAEGQSPGWCVTEFEIENIDIVDFYEIEIGRRGALSYTYEELESADFNVDLTLG